MGWMLSPRIADILEKGGRGEGIDREEAVHLMHVELNSREFFALLESANRLSRESFGNKGENHFHIGINVEPCAVNCRFCSLADSAGIFTERIEFSEEEILHWVREAEDSRVDALNIMTTGTYSFKRLLEIGVLLKGNTSIPLVANTRDISHKEGEALLKAGFVGAYHALRLGEGKVTPLSPEKRIGTIRVIKDVGLQWANCIEPVGPEHTTDEILDLMYLAREHGATYSGVMRRINFPGSPMAGYGMITEIEMSKLLAVSRLIMGNVARAHCVHEPYSLSLLAGANLFFPEVGASPRDGKADTGEGRGKRPGRCREMFREMHWDPDLPSNCFP